MTEAEAKLDEAIARYSRTPRTRNTLPPLSEIRIYRLERSVRIADVARLSGLTVSRVSFVERFPELSRPGELDLLRAAADAVAEAREMLVIA